jgi:type I restriction enzyme S subunit
VAAVVPGKTPTRLETRPNGEVPFYKVGDMNAAEGRFMRASRTYVDRATIERRGMPLLRRGTVIFPKVGGAIATNKKRLLTIDAVVDTNSMAVVPDSQVVIPEYLYFWFQMFELSSISYGSPLPQISRSTVENLQLPLAPFGEQARIVEVIEEQFSRLDAGVESLERAKRNLRRLRESVLQAAVEGRLVARDGDRWASVTVGEAGHVKLGRQRAPKYHVGTNMRPYLRVANVFENRIVLDDVKEMEFDAADYNRYRLEPGDILLNEGQSPELLGRPAMYRGELPGACFTNTLLRFRPRPSVDGRFAMVVFRHYLHSGRFRRESRITTNIGHLSASRFSAMEFPVPPVSEQQRIVAEVDRRLSILDAMEEATEGGLKRAGGLRQAILREAFAGRLVPQDPSDEPASTLLESTRAERVKA